MSEVKPLSAEAVALLLRLTDPKTAHSNWKIAVAEESAADELYNAGLVESVAGPDHWTYPPSELGKTFAATIDQQTHLAIEGERRRIDGLARSLTRNDGSILLQGFTGPFPPWRVTTVGGHTEGKGDTIAEALEAGANSLNKEQQ